MKYADHAQYQRYLHHPPEHRGNGAASAYHNGRNGYPCRYIHGSSAWAAWHAGNVHRKQAENR